MEVKVKPGQTIYDLALQEYGSIEGVVIIAQENDLDLEEDLVEGSTIRINSNPIDQSIVNYYKDNGIFPKSGGDINVAISGFSDGFKQNAFK